MKILFKYQAHYDPSLEQDDTSEVSQRLNNQGDADQGSLPEGAMSHWMSDQSWASAAYPSNYMPVIGIFLITFYF